MLDLVLRNKLISMNKKHKKDEQIKSSKHFPSSTREWNNSIYVYNKENLNLIPTTALTSINIIKSYFSLFNDNIEKKIRTGRLALKFRRLSSNKIYISNGEFKHTNGKVIINLYLFNRQKNNYLLAIRKLRSEIASFEKSSKLKKGLNNKKSLHKTIDNKKSLYKILRKSFYQKLKAIKSEGLSTLERFDKEKYFLIGRLKKDGKRTINNYIDIYTKNFYKNFINKSLLKIQFYMYYLQLNYINNTKYKYTYLQYLKEQLYKLYNKQVEFNLIDLKRFYLNSDVLSESITKKITRNRKNIRRYLKKLENKVKINTNISFIHKHVINNKQDEKKDLTVNNELLKKTIIKNLKYKDITGFRLEAKGRLTRRYTASRSMSIIKYKGNLLNIDSSIKGLSSVLLKGNLKSNVQFTKLSSKSRIGSFGIKGWVSGN